MMRRKIKRGLPLLSRGKVAIDDDLLNARDREAKMQGKEREDRRHGARECQVKPGDRVVVERTARGKAESRFDPRKHTVMEENNGMLVLNDEAGQTLRRHVSQTKKVGDWRKASSPEKTARMDPRKDNHGTAQNPILETKEADKDDDKSVRRPVRNKRSPAHLKNYVRVAEQR